MSDEQWWPAREQWPEFAPEASWAGTSLEGTRLGASEALALLLLADVAIPLNGGKENGIALMVNCSDVFYWGCSDAEPIPPVGFGADLDRPFWDLYDAVRKDGDAGATRWCCLRREMRPQTPLEERMRERGEWTPELEALPPRDPKECG